MGDCFSSDVLRSYVAGELPRSTAMQRLGIDWYGDLLVMLNQYGLPRPHLSDTDSLAMDVIVKQVFDGGGRNGE